MSSDLVSVGFLVWNDAPFLRRALDSLLAQSHARLEIIVCDDGSTDGSAEICQEYARNDPRIRYVRHASNLGISHNMEFALAEATGKYFMWAADDDTWDTWDPQFVERLVAGLEQHPDCIVAFCPCQPVDEDDRPIPSLGVRARDYADRDPSRRLRKRARAWDDGCGYGLFRRAEITVPFSGDVVRGSLATLLRYANCHVKCVEGIYRGGGSAAVALRAYPALLLRLLRQSQKELVKLGGKAVLGNRTA